MAIDVGVEAGWGTSVAGASWVAWATVADGGVEVASPPHAMTNAKTNAKKEQIIALRFMSDVKIIAVPPLSNISP